MTSWLIINNVTTILTSVSNESMSCVSPYGSITDHEESHLQVIWAPSCVQGLSQSSNQKICHWKLEFLATRAWYCVDCAHVSISLARITGRGCDRLLVCAFRIYQPSGLFDASSYDLAYKIMSFVSFNHLRLWATARGRAHTKRCTQCTPTISLVDASVDQSKHGIESSISSWCRCHMVRQGCDIGQTRLLCLHEEVQFRRQDQLNQVHTNVRKVCQLDIIPLTLSIYFMKFCNKYLPAPRRHPHSTLQQGRAILQPTSSRLKWQSLDLVRPIEQLCHMSTLLPGATCT